MTPRRRHPPSEMTGRLHPDQLSLLLFNALAEALRSASGHELCDRRRMPQGKQAGPERLLRVLVQRGLTEDAVQSAAALVLALDRDARRESA